MLARLISSHQVVVLCDSHKAHLFYHNKVYTRPAQFAFEDLPTRKETRYFPIWALIDVDYEERGPHLASTDVWPIQTSSPNPIRWNSWLKQHGAVLLGMPVWTRQELIKGYVFSSFSLSTFDHRSIEV